MIETLKKTLLAGLGAAAVTREKVQAGLDEFVKQGKISAGDARAMAEKLAEDGKREFEAMSSKVGDRVRDLAANFDQKLTSRIEELEARVAALEASHAKPAKQKTRP